mmetsp:Transcript_9099/g.26547  ORF Transcript_9099/g.26547 Transcript_9099/m.26547 type:complete len:278 (-) Transcript_9099:328-1161(-)
MEPGDDGFRIEYLYWRHADPKVPRGGVALGERFDGAFSRFRAAPEPPDPGAVIPAPASPVWTQHRKKFKSDEVMAVGSEDDAKVEEPAAMQAVMGEAAVVTTVEPTGASGDDGSASPLPVLPASAESARALDARIDLEDTGINLGTQRPDLEPLVEPKHYDGLPTGLGPVSSSAEEDAARAVDERILYHDTGLGDPMTLWPLEPKPKPKGLNPSPSLSLSRGPGLRLTPTRTRTLTTQRRRRGKRRWNKAETAALAASTHAVTSTSARQCTSSRSRT